MDTILPNEENLHQDTEEKSVYYFFDKDSKPVYKSKEVYKKEAYDLKVIELRNEKVSIQVAISKQEELKPVDTLEPVKKIFERGIIMRNDFLGGNDLEKHEILKTVLWNISIKDGKIITRQYKSPYQTIANSPKNLTISQMRREWDSNPRFQ